MSDTEIVLALNDDEPPAMPKPQEFEKAPAWAWLMHEQQRRDRHRLGNEIMDLRRELKAMGQKLGEEPASDGTGGKGIIGDLRKLARDVAQLMGLKNKGVGFAAAIGLTSTILIAGLIAMVRTVATGSPK